MDRAMLQDWLDRYVLAWRSYDPERIGDLFTQDAAYRYHPHDEPILGRGSIVASWTEDRDEPGSWSAAYEPFAVDNDAAVAVGVSSYLSADGSVDRIYDNVFAMRFARDDRCTSFTEWFTLRPGDGAARADA